MADPAAFLDLLRPAGILSDIWLAAAAVVFCAGMAKGMTGFGSALVMVPVLSLLYGPAAAIVVLNLIDMPAALPMMPKAIRRCTWRPVLLLLLGAAVGFPLGAQVLLIADPEVLKQVIAGTVLLVAVVMATGWRYRGRPTPPLTSAAGLMGGLMGGATGLGGPPVVLFWLGTQRDGGTVRANLLVYFMLNGVVGIVTLAAVGLFTLETAVLAASLAPVFGAGLWAGGRCFGLLSDVGFRRAALSLVAMAGVSGLTF